MRRFDRHLALVIIIGASAVAATAARADQDDFTVYQQTNLVSNVPGLAAATDPNLQNPWGVATSGFGDLWFSDNRSGVATCYASGCADNTAIIVRAPAGVNQSSPTGVVNNADHVFTTPSINPFSTAPDSLIFATEDGTISVWYPGSHFANLPTAIAVDNSQGGMGAVYKGLARRGNFLFATNFRAGTVEAYDAGFTLTTLQGSFTDPDLPAGYAPFGIANIDGDLFVTYAQQNASKGDVVTGAGKGIVDVFSGEGIFLRRFASGGSLNAPWGITRASYAFGQFGGDILIGNFGDGRINAFGTRGRHLGALRGLDRHPIVLPGLWSLFFGTFAFSDPDVLYFTAGLSNETNGLFGSLAAVTRGDHDTDSHDGD
jgi:uncharacterized protein (TIGR03118 family)